MSKLVLLLSSILCVGGILVSAIPKGGLCAHAPTKCNPPYLCLGEGLAKKCFKKKGLGMICGLDPYWVCEDDLICVDRICKNPVGRAGSCNSRTDGCRPPLSCVGRRGNRKCFMKKGLGDVCGKDPFWVCEDGLTCEDNKCRETPVDVGGSCNFPGEVCIPPSSCIGNDGNKRCFGRKTIGEPCGKGAFGVCKRGLFCDGICKATIGKGKPCNSRNEICHPSLKCEGPPGKKVCVIRKKGLGMMCSDDPLDPYWWCKEDLFCDDGICKKEVDIGGRCNDKFKICKPPLSCEKTRSGKKCVMRNGKGKPCGRDPFWLCAKGLKCVESKCAKVH